MNATTDKGQTAVSFLEEWGGYIRRFIDIIVGFYNAITEALAAK